MKRLFDGNDILIIVGLVLMGYGLYLIWLPLVPLILGFIILLMGAVGAGIKGLNK